MSSKQDVIPRFSCPVCGRNNLKAYSITVKTMASGSNRKLERTWVCEGCTVSTTLEYQPDLVEAALSKPEPTIIT